MPTLLPVGLHIFLLREAKVFLLKRANTGVFDGLWSAPAGRLESGESASVGAKRELSEEAGVTAIDGAWDSPLIMHHKDERGERILFFFVCTKWEGNPINAEPNKCDEVRWFAFDELPGNMVPHVRIALKKVATTQQGGYLENGFEEISE